MPQQPAVGGAEGELAAQRHARARIEDVVRAARRSLVGGESTDRVQARRAHRTVHPILAARAGVTCGAARRGGTCCTIDRRRQSVTLGRHSSPSACGGLALALDADADHHRARGHAGVVWRAPRAGAVELVRRMSWDRTRPGGRKEVLQMPAGRAAHAIIGVRYDRARELVVPWSRAKAR